MRNFGPLNKFGHIKFAAQFNSVAWTGLVQQVGATYVIPTAELHDWISLWDGEAGK